MRHELKTINPYFTNVLDDVKTFEIRYNDRDYEVGDTLILKEWENEAFTDRTIEFYVGYVLKQPYDGKIGDDVPNGLQDGYVIMADDLKDFLIDDDEYEIGDMIQLSDGHFYEILYKLSHDNFPQGIKPKYFVYSLA